MLYTNTAIILTIIHRIVYLCFCLEIYHFVIKIKNTRKQTIILTRNYYDYTKCNENNLQFFHFFIKYINSSTIMNIKTIDVNKTTSFSLIIMKNKNLCE